MPMREYVVFDAGTTLQPMGGNVVLQVLDPEQKTPGGVILPAADNSRSAYRHGRVVAVGPLVPEEQKKLLQTGARVLVTYAGDYARCGDTEYLVVGHGNIQAVVHPPASRSLDFHDTLTGSDAVRLAVRAAPTS
jgi:co-chaperonin GroES (HSP10)